MDYNGHKLKRETIQTKMLFASKPLTTWRKVARKRRKEKPL